MLNVLILDDQIANVQAIVQLMDWKSLLIDHVYPTNTPKDARFIFQNCQVDLLLCDIEMPQESGIEFVSWVRQNYPLCECIFITSHADFKYAQTAISLGCFEYILQPVSYEILSKSITKAVAHIIDSRKMREYYQNSQYGKLLQNNMIQKVWKQLILDGNTDYKNIQTLSGTSPISDTSAYLPILVHIRYLNTTLLNFDTAQTIENIRTQFDTFSGYLHTITTVIVDDAHLVLITPADTLDSGKNQLQGCLQLISGICRDRNSCILQFFIGTPCFAKNIHTLYKKLHSLSENPHSEDEIFHYSEPLSASALPNAPLPPSDNWAYIITAGKLDKIIHTIQNYLQDNFNIQNSCYGQLFPLHRLMDKAFCDSLELRNISLLTLIENPEYQSCYIQACQNPEAFQDYLNYIFEFNASLPVLPQEDEHSVVVKIQNYIDLNIEGDLSRNAIARHIYLSEDYISHIFKKETGTSLINYINNKKMLLAKKLLSTTSLPVNLIAARVGFTNFSYFTKLYKKTFDISPAEYRSSMRTD